MSSLSVVSVWNMALNHAGVGRTVQDVSENSSEARVCRQFYDSCRRALLEAYPWNFACTSVSLAPVASGCGSAEGQEAPAVQSLSRSFGRMPFVFAYPPKALRVVSVFDLEDKCPCRFAVAYGESSRLIAADAPVAFASVIYDVEDPCLFPPLFAEALALRLACDIISPLTGGSMQTRQMLYQLAETKVNKAVVALANEQNQLDSEQAFDVYSEARR